LGVAGLLFLLVLVIANPVLATDQTTIGVSVAPAQAALTVTAGESSAQQFQVTNTTDHDETLQAVIADYDLSGKTVSFLELGTQPESAAAFVDISPTRFDLTPHETTAVTLHVAPGIDQKVAKYRNALIFGPSIDSLPPSDNLQALVAVTGNVASLVGVTVNSPSTASRLAYTASQLSHRVGWYGWLAIGLFLAIVSFYGIYRIRNRSHDQIPRLS